MHSGADAEKTGSVTFTDVDDRQILPTIRTVAKNWGSEAVSDHRAPQRVSIKLPISAGVRISQVELQIDLQHGGRADWTVQSMSYKFHRQAIVILVLGAGGGLAVVFWPFFPTLLPLASLGLVLTVSAWLLVGSRLRYRGVDAFWQDVEDLLVEPGEPLD